MNCEKLYAPQKLVEQRRIGRKALASGYGRKDNRGLAPNGTHFGSGTARAVR